MKKILKKSSYIFCFVIMLVSLFFIFQNNNLPSRFSSAENDTQISARSSGDVSEFSEDNEKSNYTQNPAYMVYFAVYYITVLPSSNTEPFVINEYFSPQKSDKGGNYEEQKASVSSVFCKMTYADKEFCLYGNGVTAHNREFIQKNMFVTMPISAPKVEVITAKNGYKYIGYTYKNERTKKYNSTCTLKHAKNLKELDGTSTTIQGTGYGIDENYCTVISLYFYTPTSVKLTSNNENLGRFSENKNASFEYAQKTIGDYEIQMGLKVDTYNGRGSEKSYLRVYGTYTNVVNGKKVDFEKDRIFYIITKDGAYQNDYYNLKGYVLSLADPGEFRYEFTQKTHYLSFKILSSVADSESFNLQFSFANQIKKIALSSGINQQNTIILENIPKFSYDALFVNMILTDNTKKYCLSPMNLGSSFADKELINNNSLQLTDELEIEDDTNINEILLYVYEVFDININTRTTDFDIDCNFYKLCGVDFKLSILPTGQKHKGFSLVSFSAEPEIPSANIITDDTNSVVYANWIKTISANIFSYNSGRIVESKFEKVIKNFSDENEIEVSSSELPIEISTFYHYSTDALTLELSEDFENRKVLKANQTLFAFYVCNISVSFDTVDLNGETLEPFNKTTYVCGMELLTYNGSFYQVPDKVLTKEYCEFLGYTIGGNSDDETMQILPGQEIYVEYNEPIKLYPNFKEKFFTISVDTNGGIYTGSQGVFNKKTNTYDFKFHHKDRLYIDSNFKYFGYKLSTITAKNHNEKISGRGYDNVEDNDLITLTWIPQTYNFEIKPIVVSPTGEKIDIAVTYSYFDILQNQTIKNTILLQKNSTKYDSINLNLPANTMLELYASISAENYNLAFSERTNDCNKNVRYTYKFDSETNNQLKLFLTKVYNINLNYEANGENKTTTIYKLMNIDLNLPKNLASKNGFAQRFWSESQSGENQIYKLQASVNKDMTLYAVYEKFANFYFTNSTTPDYTLYPKTGEIIKAPSISNTINGGAKFTCIGFSADPNSSVVSYWLYDFATNKIVFNESIDLYAVWSTTELTKSETKNVNVQFIASTTTTITVSQTILYSDFTVYANVDFSNLDFSEYTSGTKTYSNEKIDFVHGEKLYNNKKYLIYGWNNNGYIDDDFFTEDDEILIKDNLTFYPIYRDDIKYDITEVYHHFYFRGKTAVTRTTNAYTRSNTFYIYNTVIPSGMKSICDGKTYETTYDNLTFDSLNGYLPKKPNDTEFLYNNKYTFLGWAKLPSSTTIAWDESENSIEVGGDSNWFAVIKHTYDQKVVEDLSHTFVTGINKSEKIVTTKTTIFKNVTILFNNQIKDKISDGEAQEPKYSTLNFNFLDINIDTGDNEDSFLGWSYSKDSLDIIKEAALVPETELTFYPVLETYVYFTVKLYSFPTNTAEILSDQTHIYDVNKRFETKVNFDHSKYEMEILKFQIGYSMTNPKFLGWIKIHSSDEIYKDFYTFENISKQNTVKLVSVYEENEVYTVTITASDLSVTYTILEGEEFELIEPEAIDGKTFKYYTCNGRNYNVGEKITIEENAEIVAVYKNIGEEDNGDNNNNNSNDNNNQPSNNESKSNKGLKIILIVSITFVLTAIIAIILLAKFTNLLSRKNNKNVKK